MIEQILQFIGGATVAILGLAALVYAGLYLFIRMRFGRGGVDLLAAPSFPTPARITLRRDVSPSYYHPDTVRQLETKFRRLGFFTISHYQIDELPHLSLLGLYHPGENLLAAICDHPISMGLFEVAAHHVDGVIVKATNNPLRHPELVPPGSRTVYEKRLTPTGAVARVRDLSAHERRIDIDDRNFVEEYETAYARGMDAVLKQGEVSEAFVRANAAAYGVEDMLGPDDIAAARANLSSFFLGEIETACIGNFLRSGVLDAARWERLRKRVFVIHERMSAETVLGLLGRCVNERHLAQLSRRLPSLKGLRGVTLFEKLNASLPVTQQVQQLGVVHEPVRAHILSAP